jgi:O-antigen ligase
VLLWFSEPEGGRTLLFGVAAVLMTLSLLMTGSRSGIGGFAIVGGCILVATRRFSTRTTTIVMAMIALVLFAAALQWAGPDAALGRFGSDTESLGLRLRIWKASWDVFTHVPLWGTGLNTFGTSMILFQPADGSVHYQEAHNDYVQIAVEGGLVAITLTIAAIAAVVRTVAARFRAGDDGLEAHWVRVGAATGLVAIGAQSLVEFSLQMPGNAALFSVLLAVALFIPTPLKSHPRRLSEGD